MRLRVEELENRLVLAVPVVTASAVLSQGVLSVKGSDAVDVFTLRVNTNTNNLVLTCNASKWTFPVNSVTRVDADLGMGNDVWNGLAVGFAGAQHVLGAKGDDTITTGQGNDLLQGGQGNDVLNPGGGQDVVYGGLGNDTIDVSDGDGGILGYPADFAYAGDGHDTLIGGSNDRLFGEEGNDYLTALGSSLYGATYMKGGAGDDTFYAQQGQYYAYDTILGGLGNDRLFSFDSIGLGNVNESVKGVEQIG